MPFSASHVEVLLVSFGNNFNSFIYWGGGPVIDVTRQHKSA